MRPILKLIIAIAIPVATGLIASWFTAQSVDTWFRTLNRPSFAPPNWLFGPVWTVLYVLMGISLYIIWKQPPGVQKEKALFIFGLQLALNFLWSFLFFYLKNPAAALIDIILLWILIIVMLTRFYRLKPIAAWLNIPYLLWVSFATALNYAFWQLN
ncbi:TspO/MBR family protein [Pseudoflavitalea rhizosphaerae]|uniref:TspO/MBR family protein n=1 Tax=Pseudoflavitalea rhizosphaerae TaxID=1884793 RepID=UPI000F8EB8CD|nr:TspO/MBR family protein [Pseudoflavitalea rhizosphaerae]